MTGGERKESSMKIEIRHLIEGARQADGLTVIIDVFRAFSMECWLYALGAAEVRPVSIIYPWMRPARICSPSPVFFDPRSAVQLTFRSPDHIIAGTDE